MREPDEISEADLLVDSKTILYSHQRSDDVTFWNRVTTNRVDSPARTNSDFGLSQSVAWMQLEPGTAIQWRQLLADRSTLAHGRQHWHQSFDNSFLENTSYEYSSAANQLLVPQSDADIGHRVLRRM